MSARCGTGKWKGAWSAGLKVPDLILACQTFFPPADAHYLLRVSRKEAALEILIIIPSLLLLT